MSGNFVVKATFNELSKDQAVEHVNKITNVAPVPVEIIKSQGTSNQWCLTFNERRRIVDEGSAILDIHTADEDHNPVHIKKTGPSRTTCDKQDFQKIV